MIGRILYWRACQRMRAIASQDPLAVQRDLLLRLLRRAAGTRFGQEHGFAEIRSPEEFRERVPAQDYASMRPWFERARDGAADETWPGVPERFAVTGSSKHFPHTKASLRSALSAGGDALFAYLARSGDRHVLRASVAFLGGSPELGRFGSGIAWGDNTGIVEAAAPAWMRAFRTPSAEVLALRDWEEKIAAAARELARADVRVLVGLPSWVLVLLDAVEEAAGAPIRDVWPSWKGFLHGGVAFAPYATTCRRRAGEGIVFVDCYAATQGGVLAVQDRDGDPSLALLLDRSAYFEFAPADDPARRVGVEAVEVDRPYLIHVTTDAGLWAYRIGDVVRFTSVRPPRLVVEGRRESFLNAFGEHVSQEEIERAVAEAAAEHAAEIREFAVQPEYPDARASRGRHAWLVEFGVPPMDLSEFAATIDAVLLRGNDDYRAHRAGNRQLLPPIVRPVSPGTFAAWLARHRRQKVPRVLGTESTVLAS
jgi:hypothetical protein